MKAVQQRIVDYLKPFSEGVVAVDVRVGLGYTSVRLDNGNVGIAWTALDGSGSCTYEPRAGTLGDMEVGELLAMLSLLQKPLSRSIGLAAANALAAGLPRHETTRTNILDLVSVQPSDHVVMVGFFGPLVPVLRQTGCRLDILELQTGKPGTMTPDEGRESLAACTVALITATTVVTGTTDEILAGLKNPRAAVILGPSTFMRPEVFIDTPVTHLAGVRIRDAHAVEKIVSEGGGTMIMKKHVDFETILAGCHSSHAQC